LGNSQPDNDIWIAPNCEGEQLEVDTFQLNSEGFESDTETKYYKTRKDRYARLHWRRYTNDKFDERSNKYNMDTIKIPGGRECKVYAID
jgi:hypothetical protein